MEDKGLIMEDVVGASKKITLRAQRGCCDETPRVKV